MALRQSTWSAGCHDESEQPWPEPGGPDHYSDQTRGCPLHCRDKRDTSYLRTAILSLPETWRAWRHCLRLSKTDKASSVNKQTCHVLCPQDGSEHGRPQDERSRLAQGSRLNECNARMCGTTGRLGSAARPL